jgi:hypothetical protein
MRETNEPNEPTEKGGSSGDTPRLLIGGAIGIALLAVLAFAAWFYFWVLVPADQQVAGAWGVRGDAMGPFVALLNFLALVAALVAVNLQRIELAENRRVMMDQQKEMARTAEAQAALAKSQERLADAQDLANRHQYVRGIEERERFNKTVAIQDEANRLAWFAELAQRRSSVAALYGAKTSIDVARGRHPLTSSFGQSVKDGTVEILARVSAAIEEEQHRIQFLEKKLTIHRTSPGGLDDARQTGGMT